MKSTVTQFIAGAFGLIALFLIVAHAGGFAQATTATFGGLSTDFQTLQGR